MTDLVRCDPAPPRVGPYELLRCVGQGGMAQVWLARRTGIAGADKPCAIKLPLPHLLRDERFRRMFLAEARLAMRLCHSNIVGTFDVGEDDDWLYIAMDWVDGMDLACFGERLRQAGVTLPIGLVAHIIGEILDALAYAHAIEIDGQPHAIVHRDVSPHNVLISACGEIRLTDFGIARVIAEDTSHEHAKGKVRYMAAEHLRGQATQRSDLFAVGAILHELLDGRKFRHGLQGDELFGHVLDGHVPPLARTDVPVPIERLRRTLLEPNAAHRIASAEAALAMLALWPGFRNERFALRHAYRRAQQIPAQASGLTELVPLARVQTVVQTRARVRDVTPSPAMPAVATGRTFVPRLDAIDHGPARRRTWEEAPTTRTHVAAARGAGFWLALVAASSLPTLGVGAFVLTHPAPWRVAIPTPVAIVHAHDEPPIDGTPEAALERSNANAHDDTAIDRASEAPVVAVAPASSRPPDTMASSDAGETDDPLDEIVLLDESPRPVARAAEVTVDVVLDFVDWAEVQIDRRRIRVAPRARVTVAAGRHRIRWRTQPDGPWRTAGTRELVAGRAHQLRIRDDEIRCVPL